MTSREWEFEVEAPDETQAEEKGYEAAYNHEWSMGEANYQVENVEEIE